MSNNFLKLLSSKDNLNQTLKSNNIFILLSKEGLSHAMIKSLSIGLPVICLKVPGNIDLISNNSNGYLIEDNDNKLNIIKKY